MRILLLFPPGWQFLQLPYLALPALTAYLRVKGWAVEQRDLNIEFFHHLCTGAVYADLYARAQDRFLQLSRQTSLSAIGQVAYADLAWMVSLPPENFHHRLLTARDDLQGENFYHVTSCWAATRTVNDLWGIVRAVQVMLRLTEGRTPVYYTEESSAEVLAAIKAAHGNLYWNYYRSALLPTLETQRPDLVGISVSDPRQLIPALTLGRFLKEQCGVRHVTLGGNVPTRLSPLWPWRPELFAYFDSVILYEGEEPLLALAEALAKGDDLHQVPNLIYRQGRHLCINQLARPAPIARLPTPDFGGFDLQAYLTPEIVLPIQSSRGCYWGRCAFCNFNKGVSQYQIRAAEQVVNDLRTLNARHGAHLFSFIDDALRPQSTEALADEIIASRLSIVWDGSARFDRHWTAACCRKLARAGCRTLSFGLESANARILRLMQKGIVQETVLDVLKNCTQAGIINRVSLFFGFPGETLAEAEETLDFVLKHPDLIHGVDAERYTISRCSPVAETPQRFGVALVQDGYRDMALRFYTYQTMSGIGRGESRALSLRLYRETKARHPDFALSYYPVLLYADRFNGTEPSVLVERSLQVQRVRKAETPRPAATAGPRLRQDVACLTLAYDLAAIRRQLDEGYEEIEPIQPAETRLLIDAGTRRVYSVSALATFVLQAADGRQPLSAIAAAAAGRFGLSVAQATRKCGALLQIHRGLLTQEPSVKEAENAHRLSVPT